MCTDVDVLYQTHTHTHTHTHTELTNLYHPEPPVTLPVVREARRKLDSSARPNSATTASVDSHFVQGMMT